ncbi:MAG: hypothetical protein LBT36_01715 [Oscillospiraceae bacterium]|jgi:hypothetical protein|nr:hypothetical protein [Oscillospiraceae bacterium]
MPQTPNERRARQTQFTKREVLEIVADPTNNPYEGGLNYRREFSAALAAEKKLRIVTWGTSALEYEFLDEHRLRRFHMGKWREEYYEAYEAAPGIIFFYHLHSKSIPPKMTAMCVDFNTGLVTLNNAQIGNDNYTPRDTTNSLSFGALDRGGAIPTARHSFTDDFVGKVAAWKVSPDIWLTHHYINPQFFLNEILGGGPNSVFLTIAEPAQYVKITDDIYVFAWREMAGPGLMGMDVMDWSKMQSVGLFYGISEDDRLECYGFQRFAGKWLSVEDRKKMHKEGIYSVVEGL